MDQGPALVSSIAMMGEVGARRLEFLLSLMTGREILELSSRSLRNSLVGVETNGLRLRKVSAPIIVLGGGKLRFRCLSCLWCAGQAGDPVRIGQAYVSGQMLMHPKADVLPDYIDFEQEKINAQETDSGRDQWPVG